MTIGAVERITAIILPLAGGEETGARRARAAIKQYSYSLEATVLFRRRERPGGEIIAGVAVGGKFYQRLLRHRSTKIRYPAVIVELRPTNYYVSPRTPPPTDDHVVGARMMNLAGETTAVHEMT